MRERKANTSIAPYTDNSQEAIYTPVHNGNTEQKLHGIEYWQTLTDVLNRYLNHAESKLEGEKGLLRRITIFIDCTAYIGKEAKNIEQTGTLEKAD